MRKGIGKSIIGGMVACLTMVSMCMPAYAADNQVQVTQDDIVVTKTANWTKLNGKTTDSNGNPYIKVDFKIDISKALIKKISEGGPADIVLVVDNTASYKDRFPKAKKAAAEFAEKIMSITSNTVRVGVVDFGNQSYIRQELSEDKDKVRKAIDNLQIDPVRDGTNMHYGVYNAQKMLEKSDDNKTRNKFMIILSDGEPNRIKGDNTHSVTNGMNYTTKQLEEAGKVIDGLKVVTIGYCNNKEALEFFRSLASRDALGNQMFYTASDDVNTIKQNISEVFESIEKEVATIVYGNALVDSIPVECKVVDGTISVNDNKVTPSLLNNKQTVEFSWGNNKLESKVYEASLVMTLDKSKLTDKQLSGEEMINTNGETIDVKVDSLGSSSFAYGEQGIIRLTSPKLSLKDVSLPIEDEKDIEEDKNEIDVEEVINNEVEIDDLDKVPTTDGDNLDNSPSIDNNEDGELEDKTPDTGDAFNGFVLLGIFVSGISVIVTRVLEKRKCRY